MNKNTEEEQKKEGVQSAHFDEPNSPLNDNNYCNEYFQKINLSNKKRESNLILHHNIDSSIYKDIIKENKKINNTKIYGQIISNEYTKKISAFSDFLESLAIIKPYGQVLDITGNILVVEVYTINHDYITLNIAKEDFIYLDIQTSENFINAVRKHREDFIINNDVDINKCIQEHIEYFEEPSVNLQKHSFLPYKEYGEQMNTYRFFMSSGVFVDERRFMEYTLHKVTDIESVLNKSVEGDYVMYLPADWVHYVGYNREIVNEWITFINGMDFEIPLINVGFSSIKNHEKLPTSEDRINLILNKKYQKESFTILNNNNYYKIILQASESSSVNIYIAKMISLLYINHYNPIVGLTLQIKKALGNLVSNYQAFLIACTSEMNHSYFYNYHHKHYILPDIFASENNESVVYNQLSTYAIEPIKIIISNPETFIKLDSMFLEKDFENIFKLLKSIL